MLELQLVVEIANLGCDTFFRNLNPRRNDPQQPTLGGDGCFPPGYVSSAPRIGHSIWPGGLFSLTRLGNSQAAFCRHSPAPSVSVRSVTKERQNGRMRNVRGECAGK